jgi:AsmA protein
MKRALLIIGIVVALLLVVAVTLPLFFDADSFRPRIEAELQQALARPVKIGHLSLSLLAGGVSAADISIADDPAFSSKPFLQAKSLDVGLDLWPLIVSRALNVHSITVVGPQVTLLHTPGGRWNFSSLGAAHPAAAKPGAGPSNFSVEKLRVVDGRVSVGAVGRRPLAYNDVTLEAGNISDKSPIPFTVDATTPGGGKMHIEGNAGPIDRADASLTPLQATIAISGLDLARTGFLPPDSGIAGLVDYKGSTSSDGKTLRSEGAAKIQDLRLVKNGTPARQPVSFQFVTNYDLQRQVAALDNGELRTGNSVVHINGTLQSRAEGPVVQMKLAGHNLPITDLTGLLPALGVSLPAGSSLQGGTATANLAIDGALDKLVTTGTVDLANVKLANFNLGSKMKGVATLAGVRTGSDTTIQAMNSRLRIAPEGIRAESLTIIVPEFGTVTGAGTVSNTNALNFKMAAKLNNQASLVSGLQRVAGIGQVNKPIPFLVQGTTSNPVFLPDVGGLVTNTITAPGQGAQGLGGILGGFFQKKKKK